MGKHKRACLLRFLRGLCWTAILFAGFVGIAAAQTEPPKFIYSRVNTFGVFGAYSGDSSHMLLGSARNRKLLNIGVVYGRRLIQGPIVRWEYNIELTPIALESDPLVHSVLEQLTPMEEIFVSDYRQWQSCSQGKGAYSYTLPNGVTYSGTITVDCSRTWTAGMAFSPVGMQWNFRPRHKLQPIVLGHGGYTYSSQAIPIDFAGSFNFTFDLGVGVELFRSSTRSMRFDYRYHHISNAETAAYNPGIDNGVIQFTYAFGR